MKQILIGIIFSIALAYLNYASGNAFETGAFKDLLQVLLNTSAIIFALIGVWIAVVFPNAMARTFNSEKFENSEFKEADSELRNLRNLVKIILFSAATLVLILLIHLIGPILLKNIPNNFKNHLFSFGIGMLTLLTYLQACSLWEIIKSNYILLRKLRTKLKSSMIDALSR